MRCHAALLALACDPTFDPLKRDPRFEQMLAGPGLHMGPVRTRS
jgi:hypothetical protein